MQALGHPILGDEFYAIGEALCLAPHLQLHSAELSFFHPCSDKLHTLFVPCDFYPEAEPCLFHYFQLVQKLPDYKILPRP